MDETRALLDALMGPNRNKKEATSAGAVPDFASKTVCKNFLVGFCPHDWFTTPKRQLTSCSLIHSELMKDQFERHPEVEKYRAWYEEDFLNYLQPIARDCDAYIVRERAKCRPKASGDKIKLPRDVKDRVEEMERRYAELVKKSEEVAEESVSKSKEYMDDALIVKEELDNIKGKYSTEGFQGEDICEVCGVKYPLGNGGADWHDKESHKKGKTHTGYAEIRAKIDELIGKRRDWEKHKTSRRKEYEAQLEKERKDEERQKRKEKQREEERQREREKEKEKERQELRERERQFAEQEAKEKAKREEERRKQKEKEKEKKTDKSKSRRGKDGSGSRSRSRRRDRSRGRKGKSDRSSSSRGKKRERDSSSAGSRRKRQKEDKPPPPPPGPPPEATPQAPAEPSSDEDSQDGIDVAVEDVPEFWARIEKLKGAVRNEAVAAMSSKSKSRLQKFLVARKTKKKEDEALKKQAAEAPEFWARIEKLKGEERTTAVASLDDKSKERLEKFLAARAALKDKTKKPKAA